MNYFIEGLQGSGKSTLLRKMSERHPECRAIYEGDYSPVELAWCAYVDQAKYREILEKYGEIRPMIEEKSVSEGDREIICYTKILTDIPGFHRDLEQYEIYNNRVPFEEFRRIVLGRFRKWDGAPAIHECALFQNIVEDMILFRNASDEEILDFYREIREAIGDREFQILFLQAGDIEASFDVIRKERSDDQGNELWFPLMMGYFNDSPYARARGISGEKALMDHFRHRQKLELQICREVFPGQYTVLESKNYRDEELS